jgi:Cu+-exporting ATPase
VFDKTGTLTLGKTSVCDFIVTSLSSIVDDIKMENLSLQSTSLHNLLHYLLIAESSSSHPLAKGITEYCNSRLKEIDIQLDFSNELNRVSNENSYQTTVVPGQGIKLAVTIDQEHDDNFDVLVGSQGLLHSHGVNITSQHADIAAGLRGGGKVAIFMSIGSSLRVIIGVSDPVRPDAAAVVAKLREKGIRCYMVTGDERATAVAIGKVVGISVSDIFAGAKPDDKEKFLKKLQSRGKIVAFIGDGTNDSPALARADVGFALAGGTDIAIEAGDIVLCRNDLSSMITAIDLASKTMRRIKINYFWALFYNSVLVPISAGVLFPSYHFALVPMYAGMAMALSSVCIVLSSLFLLLYTPPVLLGEYVYVYKYLYLYISI